MVNTFLSKSLIGISLTFSVLVCLVTGRKMMEMDSINLPLLLSLLLFIVLVVAVVLMTEKYINRLFFLFGLVLISFTIRLIWIFNVDTPITSDFYLLYQAALSITEGNYDFASTQYFSTWVYQIGFSFYQAVVLFLFQDSVWALKLLNIAYSIGTIIFIYLICQKLFSEKAGRIAAVLYALYIPNILYSSVLTNQHIATFLFYFGFYLLITKYRSGKISFLYVGIILALANLMRPLAPIVLVAVMIFLFLQFLAERDHVSLKKRLLIFSRNALGITAVFVLTGKLISTAFITAGITEFPLENRDPLWKFVLGFNKETSGRYSVSDAENIADLPVGKERKEASLALIEERTEDKAALVYLFANKFRIMWGQSDASISWSLGQIKEENILGVKLTDLQTELAIAERISFFFISLFSSIALLYLLVKKQEEYPYSLFLLLIVGYVLVHLLIEIQTRYRYFIIPAFIILAGYGIVQFGQIIKKSRHRFFW